MVDAALQGKEGYTLGGSKCHVNEPGTGTNRQKHKPTQLNVRFLLWLEWREGSLGELEQCPGQVGTHCVLMTVHLGEPYTAICSHC